MICIREELYALNFICFMTGLGKLFERKKVLFFRDNS